MYRDLDERALAEACCAKDRLAEDELYTRYAARVYTLCRRYLGDADDAKDLMQEALIQALDKIPTFRYSGKGSLYGWIRRIAINKALDQVRRKRWKTISLDVRVIATSNRDLRAAVQEGKFREDLYYRLNVFPLKWPALRDRPLDIVPLARFMLKTASAEQKLPEKPLTPDAERKLLSYGWPGNVRELGNVMQRALIIAGAEITPDALIFDDESQFIAEPSALTPAPDSASPGTPERPSGAGNLGEEMKLQEFQIILDTLIECGGSRQECAERLGMSPRTLRYKLSKMREAGFVVPD